MPDNTQKRKIAGSLESARPTSGDLVDRLLEGKLREALFGGEQELRLGRLRIEGSLGRGGMGAILSAFDPVLERHVAIKSLLPDHSDDREMLLREARLLAKLDHVNVVSIYDVVEDNDGLYLVMEQVQGGDLRAWMSEKRPWQEVVALFVQMGQGLAAAHALGIVHCDVKPDNVVLSEGRPRLIDFGLAHQRSDKPTHAGTRAYLAPERVAGAPGSAAADQYAFFASLVEAIEGKRPADGQAWQHMPGWLENVARRGLSPNPEARFADMNAAVAALEPTPAKTKLLIATALVLILGLAGFALVLMLRGSEDQAQACRGSQAQVETIWTPDARAAMGAAFGSSGASDASVIWTKVDKSLEARAASWVRLRTESCLATHVRKEQSTELLDFSMRCFDQQLLAMASVTELFAAPNETVVKNAEKTVAGLTKLDACVDAQALERAVPLPEGDPQQALLRKLQKRYQELENINRRGSYKEALAGTETLAEQARALGYAPLTVRVLLARASLQVTLSDLAGAEKTFREAASAAARARDDTKVAEVWIRVLSLLAQQSRYDEALTLEPVATTSAERVPDALQVQARLHNTLGGVYLAKAQYKDAYTAYEKALEIQRRIGRQGNQAFVPAIANFGLAKWYTGDLSGAMKTLQEALEMSLADLGPDHSQVAYLRQNIADLHRQLGQLDKAPPHYKEVLRIWKKSLGPEHPNLGYPLEQLAMLAKKRGEFNLARAHIDEAMRLREKALGPDHALVLQSLTVVAEVGIAEGTEDSLARAQAAVSRAMLILPKLGDAGKRHAVYILETRALIAERNKQLRAALEDRQTVLRIRIETLGYKHRDTGFSIAQVGRTLMGLGRLKQAERNFLEAQAIFDAHPGLLDGDSIAMLQGRAEIRMRQHKNREAVALFERALERAEKTGHIRRYEVGFALARARHAAGDRTRAQADARALREALPETGQEALAASLDAWLAK